MRRLSGNTLVEQVLLPFTSPPYLPRLLRSRMHSLFLHPVSCSKEDVIRNIREAYRYTARKFFESLSSPGVFMGSASFLIKLFDRITRYGWILCRRIMSGGHLSHLSLFAHRQIMAMVSLKESSSSARHQYQALTGLLLTWSTLPTARSIQKALEEDQ